MLALEGRGEIASTGSPISPTSDYFLLNLEEGAWPKTSPRCWEADGSLGVVGIQTSVSPSPGNLLGTGEKSLMGRFQQLSLPVLEKERIELWLDSVVSAPCWGKEIAGYKIAV